MGPCPFRHGYIWNSADYHQGNLASMGPCPFRHGYQDAARMCSIQPQASMGPCPFRHGYIFAGKGQPWTAHASMGPCPFRHGYIACSRTSSSHQNASMGPCPFRHGYRPLRYVDIDTSSGFNGAMPFQAWIYGQVGEFDIRQLGFNGAMPFQAWILDTIGSTVSIPKVLQWGHALSGMDMLLVRRQGSGSQEASMGPCPFRHGYQEDAVRLALSEVGLQWGHALSGMDICLAAYCLAGHSGFNGAMPFQAWISSDRRDAAIALLASMGPCPFRHGYIRMWVVCQGEKHASMGPCPFRHGYLSLSQHLLVTVQKLQWGHALSGMDIWNMWLDNDKITLELQWGHALSGMDIEIGREEQKDER